MTPIDLLSGEGKKLLLVGDSGAGKTGAKAALIAVGYKLFGIDVDKGSDILEGLLRSDKYPYKAYMEKNSITPFYSYVPFDIPIGLVEISMPKGKVIIPGPTSADAFNQIYNQLQNWKSAEGQSHGNISTWKPDCVLDIDTISTLGLMAKTYSQVLNNHPGALADDFGRDSGAAQELTSSLIKILVSSSVKCNVIVTAHVTRVDTTAHIPVSPVQRLQEKKSVDARGYPFVVSRAFSTQVGKYFNNQFIAREEYGKRTISTVPIDNISAKSAVVDLESSYPITTGLLELFCALRFQSPPEDFLSYFNQGGSSPQPTSTASPRPVGWPGRS